MPLMLHLVPAYGRDYKSRAAVLADLQAGKDFIVAQYGHPSDRKLINLPQIAGGSVQVRYSNLRRVAVFTETELHPRCERAAFEAWMSSDGEWSRAVTRNPDGSYVLAQTAAAWNAWQAGAAWQRATVGEPA